MDVVGNGTAHGDQLRAGGDWQHPAAHDGQALNVLQQHAGIADQTAVHLIEGNEAVHATGQPQGSSRIQADVAIAATVAEGQARGRLANARSDFLRTGEGGELVFIPRQPAPGGDGYHGKCPRLPVPTASTSAKASAAIWLVRSFTANTSGSSCISPRWACIHIQLIQKSITGTAPQIIFG